MILDEYIGLVTSEHITAPKFMAMLNDNLVPILKVQELIASLPEKFDIDTAIGKQLDILGEWIGRTRNVKIPIAGVYFSWDDVDATGWDNGIWQGAFDPDSALTLLPDDQYRLLLKAKIAANSWDGSIDGAYNAWAQVFGASSLIGIQDNQDMSYTVILVGLVVDSVTLALLTGGYIPLKPEGVRVTDYSIAPDNGAVFGWDLENALIRGWDDGSWPNEIVPI